MRPNSLVFVVGICVSLLFFSGGSNAWEWQSLAKPQAATLQKDPLPASITVAEAVRHHDQGGFILDVRQRSEWEEYHIPGATLIPLDQLAARQNEIPRDKEVVVVCRSGSRSGKARAMLIGAGFTKVTNMRGGLLQWRAEGNPTVSGQ